MSSNHLPEAVELFRHHSSSVLLLGFIHNYQDMISVDSTGQVVTWKYSRWVTVLQLYCAFSSLWVTKLCTWSRLFYGPVALPLLMYFTASAVL